MEENLNELIEAINGVKFIEKTYDIMRIVDPINKRVLSYKENKIIETGLVCHYFWNNTRICDNCISLKAYEENDVFIKLEYNDEKIFMVLASPVTLNNQTVIIELLKDVTKNMTVVKRNKNEEIDINGIINHADNLLMRDHLTGVFNRRYIDERLSVDIINNSIYKGKMSLIMSDIDLFKNVNDTYGHLVGDHILREIAKILESCIRCGKDWVARYGGEEFLICLPNTNKEVANLIAERMRAKIENTVFEYEGLEIKLTTSFGVYTLSGEKEANQEVIIGFADENLYKAKNRGRNMVVSS